MLRDLESLRLTILDDASREFITESIRCYNAGAYRAAVVMAVAAAMDDLRRKVGNLISTKISAIDPQISAGHKNIEKLFSEQQAFESQLIDLTEKATTLTPADAAKIRLLLKERHLCAHPSGHASSAEEARECIASVIDIILSKPPLMGLSAVERLIERLESPLFFPSTDALKCDEVARKEISLLLNTAMPALSVKLLDALRDEAKKLASTKAAAGPRAIFVRPTPAHQNFRAFSRGMLFASSSSQAALWGHIDRVIEEPSAIEDSISLLAADPTGLAMAKPLARERAIALVRRHLGSAGAPLALRGWIAGSMLTNEERSELLQQASKVFITEPSAKNATAIAEIRLPELGAEWRKAMLAWCGSSTWDLANPSIDIIQKLSSQAASQFSSDERAAYVLNVAHRAQGVSASHSARALLTDGLGDRSDFVDSVISFIKSQPSEAQSYQTDWEAAARILVATNRLDCFTGIIELHASGSKPPENATVLSFLDYALSLNIVDFSSTAAELRQQILNAA